MKDSGSGFRLMTLEDRGWLASLTSFAASAAEMSMGALESDTWRHALSEHSLWSPSLHPLLPHLSEQGAERQKLAQRALPALAEWSNSSTMLIA